MTGQILPFPPIPGPRPLRRRGPTGRAATTDDAAGRHPSATTSDLCVRVVAPLRPRRPVDAPRAGDLPPCA